LTAGESLVVYRDGQLLATLSPTSTSWSFTDPGATDGTHQYSVRVEDGAGHVGSYSASFGLTIDTVAPDELVTVTGASTGSSGTSAAQSISGTTTGTLISGTVSSSLEAGEVLVVFRDGVSVGTGTISNGVWNFADDIGPGSYHYTAQVQDAAGNTGLMSNTYLSTGGVNLLTGTAKSDILVGTAGNDSISGVPSTGSRIGKGTIDVLTGNGGADVFVLGDSRGRFYDDGSARNPGKSDYARITDFVTGDKLQLKGSAGDYLQSATTVSGFSGTGIYYDTNHNHVFDKYDELIALLQNHGPISSSDMLFV
jgi:Ca2+-binding RTX toxin-like protein